MQRLAILTAIACAACGRIGFDTSADAAPDVVLGHDEDEDGVADLEDVCPHLVGSQADADGDRIGDDCDPEPSNPRQRLLLFATMQPGDQPLDAVTGAWTQGPDALRFDGNVLGTLLRPGAVGSVRIAIAVDIKAVVGATAQHQISLGASPPAPPLYFVELNETVALSQAAISQFDMAMYSTISSAPFPARMHTGRATLQGTLNAGTRITAMTGGWDGEPYNLTGSTPGYAGGAQVQININNLVCEVRYVWIVEW